jgi:hypothetical protein
MVSSGMLHRVALVRTDVSEEPSAFFIRVTKIGELGTTQAATSNQRTLQRNTKSYKRSNDLGMKCAVLRSVQWLVIVWMIRIQQNASIPTLQPGYVPLGCKTSGV